MPYTLKIESLCSVFWSKTNSYLKKKEFLHLIWRGSQLYILAWKPNQWSVQLVSVLTLTNISQNCWNRSNSSNHKICIKQRHVKNTQLQIRAAAKTHTRINLGIDPGLEEHRDTKLQPESCWATGGLVPARSHSMLTSWKHLEWKMSRRISPLSFTCFSTLALKHFLLQTWKQS